MTGDRGNWSDEDSWATESDVVYDAKTTVAVVVGTKLRASNLGAGGIFHSIRPSLHH